MNRIISTCGPWPLLLLIAPGAAAQNLDSVMGARGTTSYGTVTEVTPAQVTLTEVQGSKKLFPVNELQKVAYGNEPRELRKARDSILRGQHESARSDLELINLAEVSRPEILQDIAFFKALCDARLALVGGGDKAAAVRALLAFLSNEQFQNSFHHFAAIELVGDLAVGLGRYENAIEYYQRLAEAPWPDYQLRARELEARALVANDQHPEALRVYEQVLASALDTAEARELKQLANCGKAVCLAATGNPREGIQLIQSILAEHDSRQNPMLFARAYNALGNCYLIADQPEEALLAFLHVRLLFHQDPDAHAESLYHLSRLWRTLNRSERALRAQSQLQSRYSGSRWANKR
jgi:tetratricopeptide (TPR) repeat protein